MLAHNLRYDIGRVDSGDRLASWMEGERLDRHDHRILWQSKGTLKFFEVNRSHRSQVLPREFMETVSPLIQEM